MAKKWLASNYPMRMASQHSAVELLAISSIASNEPICAAPQPRKNCVPRAPEGHVGATAEKQCHCSNLLRTIARRYQSEAWPTLVRVCSSFAEFAGADFTVFLSADGLDQLTIKGIATAWTADLLPHRE